MNAWNLCGGLPFILLGLGCIWVGLVFIQHSRGTTPLIIRGQPHRRLSPTEGWVWFVMLAGMGLGWVGFGVTFVRHAQSSSFSVPPDAPFIDHVIEIASVVGVLGGVCLMVVVALIVDPIRERRWRASHPVLDADDEDLLDHNSADGSLVSLRFTLQLLAASAPDQLAHVLPPQRGHVAIDMAEGYEQWASAVPTSRALTDEQAHALQALSAVFAAQDQAEHPTFWEDGALVADARWEQVRQLARAALVAVAWPVEVPPRQQDVGWEGIA